MASIFAVQMLMALKSGADTHAEDDYRRWLAEAGYARVELVEGVHPRETLLMGHLA